jgi:transcriptional antiterminator
MIEYTDAPERYHEPSEVERCMEWLVDMLGSGPMSISELADEQLYSKSTIIRARERIAEKIENTEGNKSPGNKWQLMKG